MGLSPANTIESAAAQAAICIQVFFNKFKFKIHGYSYVHHQALFGQVHVCPV